MIPQQLLTYAPAPDLLKDRVILVTGATGSIGNALSQACATHGATVILLDKVIKSLERVYDEIEAAGGPQPAIYPMNLEGATAKDYQDLAENIGNEFGRLDGLVHNAAFVGYLTPLKHYDLELWARVITVNLHAPFLLTHGVLPLLEQSPDPSVVFSTHDCQKAYWGGFGVAKAGLKGLMEILSKEYQGDRKMRVNGVDTGPIRSQLRAEQYPGEDPTTLATPEEVIGPYLYLLGPDSAQITGQNLKLA
ncbi:NAD(P)-dependent dehydrogenase, short-chain alcohol dehydrogenase family [Ectothiorhodospira magna]|uniref:NAD(P)-dependent dehydrogenase, short-chain alcohol dehydrogenase family n=1 Tax=Ectothiorhodospira magna TaxID=867345 RepID=A0A1H9D201_9GAMM|nr:SDR family oxidoreductase [Ectothiorhodospira magna]SEQ06853.1 NAD(P)-dependent dehydrogenase, short-chain alcohol dehydrogenase family [Ectothiorhodospira magna]